jgi:putative transposase
MPKPRKKILGKGGLHLVTSASFHRQAKLCAEKHRSLICQLLEELRTKHRFAIAGYVVMPTYIRVLISEPSAATVETVILALRKRYQRRYNVSVRSDEPAWEKTFSDIHVLSIDQITGCLSLMHEAPVKAGFVEKPSDWEWSSAQRYAGLPEGVVTIEASSDSRSLLMS